MQRKRHYADYDPAKTYNAKPIRKSEVVQDILDAEDAINRFQAVPAKDRRAFAIFVLLNIRRTLTLTPPSEALDRVLSSLRIELSWGRSRG